MPRIRRWIPAAIAVSLILTAVPVAASAAPSTGSLQVHVTRAGVPVEHAAVNIHYAERPDEDGFVEYRGTNAGGNATYDSIAATSYIVSADVDGWRHGGGGSLRPDTAETVQVVAGGVAFVHIDFPATGTITGRITIDAGLSAGYHPVIVSAYMADEYGRLSYVAHGGNNVHDDTFIIRDVPMGEVYLRASSFAEEELDLIEPSYGDGTAGWWDAESVEVVAGRTTSGVEFTLHAGAGPNVVRIGGADRFEMAANVSKAGIDADTVAEGVPVVFIASGLNYPDALSAGPLAAAYGPLLLVTPTSLPDPTRIELERLDPEQIVIVGGPNSVGPTVEALLETMADSVMRISGADRYAVSRELAAIGFSDGTEFAIVATGANFPDALAAGSYAGAMGAPVILVNGPAGSVDTATLDLIDELGVRSILIVGGPNSVPPSIAAQLVAADSVDIVRRATGADRYVAAAAIGGFHETSVDRIFLANGGGFADALAGTWLAARMGAPIALVQRDCFPANYYRPDRLGTIYVLGGPNSIAEGTVSGFPNC